MKRIVRTALLTLAWLLVACHRDSPTHDPGSATKAPEIWTCPMHLQYTSDKPGDCPICNMKLVPKATLAVAEAAPAAIPGFSAVTISAESERLLGLKSIVVKREKIAGELRTTGRVAIDETRAHKVTARFEGYVERLYADFTGKLVTQGEPLVAIYSPELVASQEEFLLAQRSQSELAKSGLPDMTRSARERLRRYGISDGDIDQLAKRGSVERTSILRAPITGSITQKTAVAGAKVTASDSLFEIVDLSSLWVLADVYENELPRLRVGQAARVTLAYWPGRHWQGRVLQILPTVDDKTRTVKVRIAIDNPKHELKPEMFADVVITSAARDALVIPGDAVIETGTRRLVFVVQDQGKLLPREIEVGTRAGGKYEITRGLAEGERIATGASFLLDSESRLRAPVSQP